LESVYAPQLATVGRMRVLLPLVLALAAGAAYGRTAGRPDDAGSVVLFGATVAVAVLVGVLVRFAPLRRRTRP
jgi:hypothetical protein